MDEYRDWSIFYYESADGLVPGEAYLLGLDAGVRGAMDAILEQVRIAPPPSFSGGGYWEAMHGAMSGYFEVRKDQGRRWHHRLFCVLDHETTYGPGIVVITGLSKRYRTTFSERQYRKVRALGSDYRATHRLAS